MTMMSSAVPFGGCSDEFTECESSCHWGYMFNDNLRKSMQETNYDAGLSTLVIGIALGATIFFSKQLRREQCYRNLLVYLTATTLRRAGPVIAMTMPFKCMMHDWIGNRHKSCDFWGMIDSFIAVFEIESLAQVCVERFIRTLYIYRGYRRPNWHNILFFCISLALAALYSILPLLGCGSYGWDFDCVSCTYDIILPTSTVYRIIVITLYVLKSVKPTAVMICSLNFARWMEVNKIKKDHENNVVFTSSVRIIVLVNVTMWFPIFLVRSTIVFAQIMNKNYDMLFSPCFVSWALMLHWAAPAFAMCGFVWFNPRVRVKLWNFLCCCDLDSDEPETQRTRYTRHVEIKEIKDQETSAPEPEPPKDN